ncbi:MAG: invasion associated locus B family protein [Pseudomonadota bacterium]
MINAVFAVTRPWGGARSASARWHAIAAALALMAGLAVPPASAQQGGDEVRDTIGDWTIRCAAGTENCVMSQVGKGPQGNDMIEVRVGKLQDVTAPDGTAVPALIQITTPLDVALKGGVRFQVDSGSPRVAPFDRCFPRGCLVVELMNNGSIDEMKRGSAARVTLVALQQGEISTNISLRGFTRAYDSLKPSGRPAN